MSTAPVGPASPPWWALLPPAEAQASCGENTHRLRWAEGRLTAVDHPDAEEELVLAALGGDRSECVDLVEWWGRRGDDLEVLAVGPRSAADELTVTPQSVAEFGVNQRGWVGYAPLTSRRFAGQRARRMLGAQQIRPGRPGLRHGISIYGAMLRAGHGAMVRARGQTSATLRPMAAAGFSSSGTGPPPLPRLRPRMQQFRDQMRRASERRAELFSLLAFGSEFQLRLSATVAAAWADGGSRASDRDRARPALVAALAGRLAPVAQAWLGVDPGQVDVSLHEGEGWGRLGWSGTGPDRRLSAALPAGWLASVWAAGLAVADGRLVVAVTAAAWPDATVLAVPEPGADPVILKVRAVAGDEGWTLVDVGDEGDGAP
jgi:hypothetical protein